MPPALLQVKPCEAGSSQVLTKEGMSLGQGGLQLCYEGFVIRLNLSQYTAEFRLGAVYLSDCRQYLRRSGYKPNIRLCDPAILGINVPEVE
jgi:hypothetical protein